MESLGVSRLPYVVFFIGHMSWFGRNASPTYVLTDVRSLFWSHLTLDLTLGVASYKSFILLFLLFLFPPLLFLLLLLLILFLLFKDRVSHTIDQAGTELTAILLPQPLKD